MKENREGGAVREAGVKASSEHIRDWAKRITDGDRRALARAITLVESQRADHRDDARRLLAAVAPSAGASLRIGLTGAPGVGKSTFIEAFGAMATGDGRRVAVLAVDPSSARTGGSILGDKTRMETLSRNPAAFVRPSPSQSTLGGVARRTREAILLCEASGYDVTLVETVGVGQSETMVAEMTDLFVLLIGPGGGDELQGVKRGVMEMADLVLVNKADGDLAAAAQATVSDYANALRLLRRRDYDPPSEVLEIPSAAPVSAATGEGLKEAWRRMQALADWRREAGWLDRRRREQALGWFRHEIERRLLEAFDADPGMRDVLPDAEAEIRAGAVEPAAAAEEAVERFLRARG